MKWQDRSVGFGVGAMFFLLSFGCAAWSGAVENEGIFIWATMASIGFFLMGSVVIMGAMIADE